MTAPIQPGYRVGKLVVADKTDQRKNGYIVWRCVCDCGSEIALDTRCLQRSTVLDCGCETNVKPGQKDLTGQRFGCLVCIAPIERRGSSGGTIWKCQCDCGNLCDAVSTQLTKGYKKSCGCLSHPKRKDYVGRQFGKLTVLSYENKENGVHRWRCLCECGMETVVRCSYLVSGHTKSCGCLQKEVYRENLRLVDGTSVTMLEASKRRVIATNFSGYNGVYFRSKSRKWIAQITFKGKTYYLGSYHAVEKAAEARRIAEAHLYDEFLAWYYDNYVKQES